MTNKNISRTMDTKSNTFNANNKGVIAMFNILSLCTKDKKSIEVFINNINSCVVEDKVTSFYDLDEDEQERLVALLLLSLDDCTEWFANCDDADMIIRAHAKYLTTYRSDDRDYFMSLLKINAVKHFSEHLDELISIKYQEYQAELRLNHGTRLSINSLRVA